MPFIRERTHRLPLAYYRGPVVVSFTACIKDRAHAFEDVDVIAQFRHDLADALQKNVCCAPIYCFMPDHLHILVSGLSENADTWRAMVAFKQKTGFWFSRHRPSFAWQKDFHDHILRKDDDLAAHVRYIADNPVRKRLVARWNDYPHTGALGIELKVVLADTATL
ncbi:MAG: transposase [Gemmataceae bacterium]